MIGRCYAIINGRPGPEKIQTEPPGKRGPAENTYSSEPVSWCIVVGDRLFTGPTLEYTKHQALTSMVVVDFEEKSGWIFAGEEEKLLDPAIQQLLSFSI